ncbi:MAG: hypothetical protein ABIT69_04235 [Sphingomicrobium sp.]
MRSAKPLFAALVLTAATAACMGDVGPRPMSPAQRGALAQTLGGRIAGPEQRCLPRSRTGDMVASGGQILFRDGSTLYLTRTGGGCEAIGGIGSTLVIDHPGEDSLCANSVLKVVNSSSGLPEGGCFVEGFIPYRRP